MPHEKEPPQSSPPAKASSEGDAPSEKLKPHEVKALARRERLSNALRSNLRRRKDQARQKD